MDIAGVAFSIKRMRVIGRIALALFLFMVFPDSVYVAQGASLTNPGIFIKRMQMKPRVFEFKPLPKGEQKGEQEEEEQEEGATGPDHLDEVDLASVLAATTPEIESDFMEEIGWYHIVYGDQTDPNVYYYLPREYRIIRDPNPKIGYKLKFTYGYATAGQSEDSISMDIMLGVPYRERDLRLLHELAKKAIGKNITLKPLPMHSVSVNFEGLQEAFKVKPENISVTNPRNIRDPITLSIRLSNEEDKEMFVTSMRDIGLSGVLTINAGTGELPIPLRLSFSEFSGPVVTEFADVASGRQLQNYGPFPITMKGVVVYTLSGRGVLKRKRLSFRSRMMIPPGGRRNIRNVADVFRGKNVVHAWFDYDADSSCKTCFAAIEDQVLASPGLTSKDALLIEAIPSLFSELDIFKIIVEVKSSYFEASGTGELVRTVQLKASSTEQSLVLYLDRDKAQSESKFSYRYKAKMADGGDTGFSPWRRSAEMDLTIGRRAIEDLTGE